MKRFARLTAVFLSVWMLLSALPVGLAATAFAAPVETPASLPPIVESDTGKAEIDVADGILDLDGFKSYLLEQLAACKGNIPLSQFNIPVGNRQIISDVIYYAMPEAFHLDARNGIKTYTRNGFVTRVEVSYYLTASEYQTQLAQVRAARDKLLEGVAGNSALTDVQKALLLHDRLANTVAYTYPDYPDPASFTDQDALELANSAAHHERATVYSCLVNHSAVCQGYALTYGYLLDAVGIENYFVNSAALNHAWNLVYIDNVPYFVDVTYDDRFPDIPGHVYHDNFLLSSGAFYASGHTARDYETLPCDTRYDNAFWQNSESTFQVIGNTVYYVDNVNAAIYTWDGSFVKDVSDDWPAEDGFCWDGNFTRLAAAGANLLYSTPKDIQEMDPNTGLSGTAYALNWELPDNDCIYSFVYEEPYLKVYKSTSPNSRTWDEIYVYYEAVPFVGNPVLSLHPMINGAEITSIELAVGEWIGFYIDLDPYDADNQNLTWYGWDDTVVSVSGADRGGVVTGAAPGTTSITIYSTDGPSVTIPVTVTDPGWGAKPVQRLIPMIDGVTEVTSIEMTVGDMVNLQIDLDPYDADNQNLTWYGWDDTVVNVAGIDRGGFIWGLTPGSTSITIYSTDGISIDVPVTVNEYVCGHVWGEASYDWEEINMTGSPVAPAPLDGVYRYVPDSMTCTAIRTCTVCGETETAQVWFAERDEIPASCEGESYTYFIADFGTGSGFETQYKYFLTGPALGHAWTDVSYTWSTDEPTAAGGSGITSCTACRSCTRCSCIESETVKATMETVGDTPVYTAVFETPFFETQTLGEPEPEPLWGDANGDGKVDNKDVVRLKNYLANWDEEAGVSSNGKTVYTVGAGADANGDGKIDNKDVVRLKNFLANWDEESGVSRNGNTVYVLGPK